MAYHGMRLLLDCSLNSRRGFWFFSLILNKLDWVFSRNGSHLHLDLEELLVVHMKVVNTVVMWGQKSSRYGVIPGATCAQYFKD